MYSKTTHSITVSVEPIFLEEESVPDKERYVWAYHVTIKNHGTKTVRLKSRYWKIMDSIGRIREIRGPGVVGEQPVLGPGESFEYTSGTPLDTPSGIMAGEYYMETTGGENFDVSIPAFSLDSPHEKAAYH